MKEMNKKIMITACILGAITIAIGAFGAHGLKKLVDANAVATFETGVRYQMYHVFAILVLGLSATSAGTATTWVFRSFLAGIVLFSGSIYLLSLNGILPFSTKWLGPITPIGGLAFIVGWLMWARGLWKNRKTF